METKKTFLIDKLLNAIPAFLALFVPIFFLPLTSEFFEFNKLTLIVVTTSPALVLWVVKTIVGKKVEIAKTPLDLPFLAGLVVYILASFFSLNKTLSIFGVYGRWVPSLFGMATFFMFYYAVVNGINNIKAINNVLRALIIGITISTIVTLLGYFGIKLGAAPYLQVINFTLTGSVTAAGILAALGTILSLSMLVKGSQKIEKILFFEALLVNLVGAILLGGLPTWSTLIVGLVAFVLFSDKDKLLKNKGALLSSLGVGAALLVLTIIPQTKTFLVNEGYPVEIKPSPRHSWMVASSIMRDYPLLGTGPSTFGLNYTRYKPASVNTESYWNIRFDKPYNELFDILGSVGLLGTAVVVILGYKTLVYVLKTRKTSTNKELATTLAVGALAISSTLLFSYATVTTSFMLVLFLGMIMAKQKVEQSNDVDTVQLSLSSFKATSRMSIANEGGSEIFQYIMAVPVLAIAITGIFFMQKEYRAEYYTRKAILANQVSDANMIYQMQQKAVQINPQRDIYHASRANTNLALANRIATFENITDEDRQTIQALISEAIAEVRNTTEILNPLSAINWEDRAVIYKALSGVADDANDWAVRAYNTAIQLDPSNPRLRLDLGGIYYAQEDYLTAANLFNQAVTLKGDYANARYNLAQSLRMLDDPVGAYRELSAVQQLVGNESADFEKVAEELATLASHPAVIEALSRPTVADLEGETPVEEVVTEQEPINTVADEQEITVTDEVEEIVEEAIE